MSDQSDNPHKQSTGPAIDQASEQASDQVGV